MQGHRSVLLLMALSLVHASYDEFLSCDRGDNGRASRAFELHNALNLAGCDMAAHTYCNLKGPAYPERAITQFIKENFGLMKRMGSELDPREVKREMRSSSSSWLIDNSHVEKEKEVREEKTSSFSLGIMPPGEHMFSGLSGLNINGQQYLLKQGSGLAMIKNAKEDVVQSRTEPEPVGLATVFRETTKRPSPRQSTSESMRTSTSETTVRVSSSQSSSGPTTLPTTASIAPSTVTTEIPGTTTDMESLETTWMFPTEGTTQRPVVQYEYEYEEEAKEPQALVDPKPVEEEAPEPVYIDLPDYEMTYLEDPEDLESILETLAEEVEEPMEARVPPTQEVFEELMAEEEELQEVDTEQKEEILYYGESINACDVDSDIKAPYWANNTGGKMLALLNLYPFEQYIHIETCQSEMQEGLCRPGCRCEQQYRMHRLLAFDPNNECRGIFSDWFRFPSFCLCKCYGALEVLKGSRDPKKADLSPVPAAGRLGPGPTHNKEPVGQREARTEDSKLNNHRLSDMPVVFPYEGRAALFAELQHFSDQEFEAAKSSRGMESMDSVDTVETLWSLGSTAGHMDNTVESDQVHQKKTRKQGRGLENDRFFYNQPIMDFALPDGTVGSLKQTPRK